MVMTKALDRFRKPPAIPPAEAVSAVPSLGLATAAIDLLPIPAALVVQCDDRYDLVACNTAFQRAGLGTVDHAAPLLGLLGGRVEAFLRGDLLHEIAGITASRWRGWSAASSSAA
jgi:hypothetical protein